MGWFTEDIQDGILKATEIANEKYADYYANQLEDTIDTVESHQMSKTTDEEVEPFLNEELLEGFRKEWIRRS